MDENPKTKEYTKKKADGGKKSRRLCRFGIKKGGGNGRKKNRLDTTELGGAFKRSPPRVAGGDHETVRGERETCEDCTIRGEVICQEGEMESSRHLGDR